MSCEFSGAVKSIKLTVISKKGVIFWRKENWGTLGRGPTFFLNRALLRLIKSGRVSYDRHYSAADVGIVNMTTVLSDF